MAKKQDDKPKDEAGNNDELKGQEQKSDQSPLGMDGQSDEPPKLSPEEFAAAKQRAEAAARTGHLVIVCPYCGARCKAHSSKSLFTHYNCPAGCPFSHKVPRPGFAERLKRRSQREENDRGFSARD